MGVELQRIVEKMKLKNLTPEVDLTKREVKIPDINRPALQLAGFFDHFESQRVQIIGYVEYTYLETLSEEQREKIYVTLMSYGVPCFIFCRELMPDKVFLEKAVEMARIRKSSHLTRSCFANAAGNSAIFRLS